ncbi:Uncharacterised protein [uncultured archaeon]|nr:Uncharacterised protein [uncultured archaeon]
MALKLNLDIDLTRFPHIIYLLVIFVASRLPFLDLGFSAFTSPTDSDVLAVVNSAYLLRYYHIYAVSRFPGSPFFELYNSLLIGGGWLATNTATMIFSFFAVILFGKILNILDIKNKSILLITFAFIPVIWINSTITMDYMWGLGFLLLAFYLAFAGKYNYSGIALSFAIACRLTSVVMIVPLLYWMLQKKAGMNRLYSFLGTTFFSSIILFSPVLYKYGLGFLKYYPREITFTEVYYGFATQILNIPAMIIILISFLVARNTPKKDPAFNLSLFVVLIYALIFIYHPSKPAYLIPAIPWGLVLLNKTFPRMIVIFVCVLVVLNGIMYFDFQGSGEKIKLDSGSVLKNYEERKMNGINQSQEYLDSLDTFLKEERSLQNNISR